MNNLTPEQVREAMKMIEHCERIELDIDKISNFSVKASIDTVTISSDEKAAFRSMLAANRIKKLREQVGILLHNYGVEYTITVSGIEEKA